MVDKILAALITKLVKNEVESAFDDRSHLFKGRKGTPGLDGESFSIEKHGDTILGWIKENSLKFSGLSSEEIESIRGIKGRDGRDFNFDAHESKISEIISAHIAEIKSQLALKFSDLTEEEKLSLRGETGNNGRDGKDGIGFIFSEHEEEIKSSISDLVNSIKEELKLKFSDLSADEVGSLKGQPGRDGRDFKYDNHAEQIEEIIKSHIDNIRPELKINFSDLTEGEKNSIRGEQGEKGPRGQRGRAGADFVFEDHRDFFQTLKPKFSDFTAEEILQITLKFGHLTDEQKNELKLKFDDLSPDDKATLKGPRGQRGRQGIQGDLGPQGNKGDKGDTGDRGPRGIPGIQGVSGMRGPVGEPGVSGIDGRSGRNAPYIYDIEANYYRDEIEFVFHFSDGTKITPSRVPLPKQINNFYSGMAGGGRTRTCFTFSRSGIIPLSGYLLYESIPSNVVGGHIHRNFPRILKISFANEKIGDFKIEVGTHTGNMAGAIAYQDLDILSSNRAIFDLDIPITYDTYIYVKISSSSTDKPKNAVVFVEVGGGA